MGDHLSGRSPDLGDLMILILAILSATLCVAGMVIAFAVVFSS